MIADQAMTWTPRHPTDLGRTVGVLRRGAGDPTFHRGADGSFWRTTRTPSGDATVRYSQVGADELRAQAWGPGAADAVAEAPVVLGDGDDPASFDPIIPLLAEAHRRFPGIRMLRTGRVLEALVPAILEQKVITLQAHDSWRALVRRFGDEAPGPVPPGLGRPMKLAPTAEVWRRIPSWEWHRAGVDPQRSRTIVTAARHAARLEEASTMSPTDAAARLMVMPGVGVWTAAEVAQRAFGDPDALAVGDYHLANYLGHALWGRDMTDDEMVEAMRPWAGHRQRVVRLLGAAGVAGKPKRGPRMPFVDHRAI
ncbi:DNA-3-methyladenine glycosylase [Agromyces sp. CF514]|uniref:DNA-3-methyladenine glycosylase family protein n=1 Tax=Agromyces sp. CF514 TaxID=1881031 RepID=UPI002100E03B|nr:DNA-3-methyladenine glycosylase 2 family protein [Agromyces sp. CF514]